jgi:hypothetical protein
MLLALGCPVLAGVCLFRDFRALFLLLGLVAPLALRAWNRPPASEPEGDSPGKLAQAVALFLAGGLSWVVAIRFVWWQPFASWITASWYTHDVFILSLLLVLANLCRPAPAAPASRGVSWAVNGLGLFVLAWASLRVRPFCMTAFHHWGAHVGPAELVRQGGWLLWDVPYQYGFLNTLLVAALPTANVWQSFYLVNALVHFLSAAFLFGLLRAIRPGPLNFCFALAVTLAAVFLVPGQPQVTLDGDFSVPNVGPFRFFWCYALLAVLVWQEWAAARRTGDHWPLAIGCLVWLVGILWSCESGAFCTAVWLPAYGLLVLRRATAFYPQREQRRQRLRLAAAWLALPPALVLVAAGSLTAYYLVRLGHQPDWRGYFEWVSAESAGFAALPIDRGGTVGALLLVLCALSTAAVGFLRRGLAELPAPLVGAWGAVWATVSYFIGSSHESRATSLAPTLCIGLAVALYLFARRRAADHFATLVKVSAVAVLTVLLTSTFGHRSGLYDWAISLRTGACRHIETRLLRMEPAQLELLQRAGVRDEDPLLCLDPLWNLAPARWARDGRLLASVPAWQPGVPMAVLLPLGPERATTYMARFTSRARKGGWFLHPKALQQVSPLIPRELPAWFLGQLARTHVRTRTFANADRQLDWYEFKGDNP